MKRTALALACIGLTGAGSVCAQSSVTMYGLVDAGVEYVNHAGPNGSVVKLTSGGRNTSRWGMRGVEDLGGGMKALFNLESGIAIDTGNLDTSGTLFDRRATVGLASRYGQVVMGRTFTTTYDFMLPFDPMGYAPNYSWATSSTATGGRKDGLFSRASNAVRYDGTFGGLKLGATAAMGEVAGDFKTSSKYALASATTPASSPRQRPGTARTAPAAAPRRPMRPTTSRVFTPARAMTSAAFRCLPATATTSAR